MPSNIKVEKDKNLEVGFKVIDSIHENEERKVIRIKKKPEFYEMSIITKSLRREGHE